MSRFNLSRWAIEHASFTRFLVVMLLAGGVMAFLGLGQKEDPDFTFRVMVVKAYWPGATAREMEQQVTNTLERKLQEVPYLDYTRSYSKPGESLIFVNVRQDTPPKEIPNVWYQVRKKLGDIRHTLPQGMQGPFFNDEFGDTYAAIYGLTGDGFSYAELKDYADRLRHGLLAVDGVEKVDLIGTQDERIWVTISHHRLAQLGLDISAIARALVGQNDVDPAGVVFTAERDVRLRVDGGLADEDAVRELRLEAGGARIRLGDVAEVARGLVDPPQFRMRVGGADAIGLGILMVRTGNVVELGPKLEQYLTRMEASFPVGLRISKVSDQPAAVSRYIHEFLKTLAEAIVIVLAVSFLSLGLRTGLVVALTIPLVLAITFALMFYFGIALQKVSLGALIIALGLLVDDAMIAVEMMSRKLEEGLDRLSAATFAYTSTAFPMLTGTLITVAGFLPVGLAKSTAGEYTFSIFAVVAIALLVSWFAAVYFTPYLGFALLRERPGTGGHEVFDGRLYQGLRRLLEACLDHRRKVVAASVGLLLLSVAGLGLVQQQFFPSSNRAEVMVDLWLPEGTGFAETERQVKRLEAVAAADPDAASVTAYVGGGSPRFYLPLDQQLENSNFGQLVVLGHDLEARERIIARLRADLAANGAGIRFRVERLNSGPPVGWPVQFRVRGEDPTLVRRIAAQVAQVVAEDKRTFDVYDDWREMIPVLKLSIDQDRARALGVSSQAMRQTLQAVTSGVTIGGVRDGDKLVSVMVRSPEAERTDLSGVTQVYVRAQNGGSVPISQLARLQPVAEEGVVWRRNRLPTITVQANVGDSVQPPDVTRAIDARLDGLRKTLPAGYSIQPGGAFEENAIGQASIFISLPLVAVATMTLLMIQLHHFGRAMMVFLTAPLGLIGAVAAMLLLNVPFGFTAILGVIALSGMVMRNSVILIDQIEREQGAGRSAREAVVYATIARFRPILLTAAAAVLALVPLTSNVFWGPMSIAMIGGLVVATVMTVTALPALYGLWFKIDSVEADSA